MRVPEPPYAELARRRRERLATAAVGAAGGTPSSARCRAPCSRNVAEGEVVQPGQVLCIVEAMKMENEVVAHLGGRVTELSVGPGEPVTTGR